MRAQLADSTGYGWQIGYLQVSIRRLTFARLDLGLAGGGLPLSLDPYVMVRRTAKGCCS
jgi:hypothetical protein